MQVAAIAEVEGSEFELGVEVPAGEDVEVPAGEDVEVPPGEGAGLCVAEHPTTATITAPVIAATTVMPGRDRLVMGDCLSLAPQALTIRDRGQCSPAAAHLPGLGRKVRGGPAGGVATSSCASRVSFGDLTGSHIVAVTWRQPVGLAEGR